MSTYSKFFTGAKPGAATFTPIAPDAPDAPDDADASAAAPTVGSGGFKPVANPFAACRPAGLLAHPDAEARPFSVAFPEEWDAIKTQGWPDFDVPKFTSPDAPTGIKFVGQSAVIYKAALAATLGHRMHLVGPPGTGKTEALPAYIAERFGMPVTLISFADDNLVFADTIGTKELVSNDHGGMDTRIVDGMLARAIQHPGIVVIDEVLRGSIEAQNGLLPLLNTVSKLPRAHLGLPDLFADPACVFMLTDNALGLGDAAHRMVGTKQADAALLSRINTTIPVKYPAPRFMAELICDHWLPGFPKREAKLLCEFVKDLQDAYDGEQLPLPVGVRDLKTMVEMIATLGGNIPFVVKAVVQDKFPDDADREAVGTFFFKVFGESL